MYDERARRATLTPDAFGNRLAEALTENSPLGRNLRRMVRDALKQVQPEDLDPGFRRLRDLRVGDAHSWSSDVDIDEARGPIRQIFAQ